MIEAMRSLRLLFLIGVLAAAAHVVPSQAQDGDGIFTVTGVAVDVSAENATAARGLALTEGQSAALETLLQRLTRRVDWPRLPTVSGRDLEFMVSDFEVANERTSAVRYLASLTVRFKPAEVRRVLRDGGVPFAETRSKPVLVLAVLRQDGAVTLWDDPNAWRDAWEAMGARETTLVPTVVPLGDLSDIIDISAEQAALGDEERLGVIADRYGAGDSLVAIAQLFESVAGPARMEVAVTRIGATAQAPILLDLPANPGEDGAALLRRGAEATADAVEDAWIEANLLQFDQEQRLTVQIAVTSLDDWLDVRAKLRQVAIVTDTQLRSLSRSEAEVELGYFGQLGQLQDALVQRDLVLEATPTGLGEQRGRLRRLTAR